jgi:ribosomal protein S18 acetylase RimI-like enzyme
MTVIAVSPMHADEAATVASLMRSVIEPLGYYNDRARAEELAKYTPDALRAAAEEEHFAVLVARDDDRIVGFCVSRYDDALVWLSWFGAHPDWRGRGVGRSLLASLGSTLAARNAHKVWCDTRTDNLLSQAVLSRFGFTKLAELRNHWYGQDFLLWEWYPQ